MRELDISKRNEWATELTVGEEVLLNGYVYTARDAVHKKFATLIEAGEELPSASKLSGRSSRGLCISCIRRGR